MKFEDYYEVLGVPRNADTESIKKAYRKLARQHHPDVSSAPEAEARFKAVAQAYATLKDPEKRAAYDQLGAHGRGEEFRPPPDWAREFGADAGAFEEMDLADLLAGLRGARHQGGWHQGAWRARPSRGRDYEATLQLSLEDAHRGATVSMNIGHEDGSRTLAVTVPPGMTQGHRLRLRGQGGAGSHGGEAGDVYLQITLLPHPVFRADRHDLYLDLPVAAWEAALGAEVEIPTLDGPVVMKVPAGTRSGRKLRVRGRGLATGHGGHGDLYALVRIDVPARLTARERELFEELSRVSQFNPRAVAGKEAAHES